MVKTPGVPDVHPEQMAKLQEGPAYPVGQAAFFFFLKIIMIF
jgi:hypothetical protein